MIPLAILAGGRSTRMGQDKLLLPVAGEPQLVRLAHLGASLGMPVWICGRTPPGDWTGPEVHWLVDDPPGCGPMGGLAAALGEAERRQLPGVVLIAGDLPYLQAHALEWLASLPLASVQCREERLEPLAGHYPTRLLQVVRERLEAGRWSLNKLAAEFLTAVPVPEDLVGAWADADTPEQWPR